METPDRYDIVILVLPTEQKLKLFRQYEQAAGVPTIEVAEGEGLKIVCGDPQITPMLKKPSRGWSSSHQH